MKYRLSILLALLLLLPCCRKETPSRKSECLRPISFAAPALQPETRVDYREKPDDPGVLIAEGNRISLFGVRIENEADPGETIEEIFNNTVLSCTDVPDPATPTVPYSSIWGYTPLKYWEASGHYYFAAVYPYSGSDTRMDGEYRLWIDYRAGDQDGNDLMISRVARYLDDPLDDGTDPVTFTMRHAVSAVRFLFGKESADPGDEFSLTSFVVDNLYYNGTLRTTSRSRLNPAVSYSDWTQGSFGNLFGDYLTSPADIVNPTDENDPDDYTQIGWFYMVPQQLSASTAIRFSVSYNGGDAVSTLLNISDCDGEPGRDSWIPNCVYNYFITLSQSGLDLAVKAVPWDEVQVTTDVITFEDTN